MSGDREMGICPMQSGEVIHLIAQICAVSLRVVTYGTTNQCQPKGRPEATGCHLGANLKNYFIVLLL
jgi:hypothetical protein